MNCLFFLEGRYHEHDPQLFPTFSLMFYLFLMPFLLFDCFPEYKPRNQRNEKYKQTIKTKKRYLCSLGLTSLLILKIWGYFVASRLKRAGSLSNRKWSDNQSRQNDETKHRNQISEKKKVHGG